MTEWVDIQVRISAEDHHRLSQLRATREAKLNDHEALAMFGDEDERDRIVASFLLHAALATTTE